jgi:hypothetical protein
MGPAASVEAPVQTAWLSRDAGGGLVQHRPPDMFCEGLQVLHDSGEVEFVACAGEAPQAHALEAVVGLEVREAHLDLLALVARFELRRTHQGACMIAGILVDVACDLARGRVWTASRFERTSRAVALRRTVTHRVVVAHLARCLEQLVCGTDVDVNPIGGSNPSPLRQLVD